MPIQLTTDHSFAIGYAHVNNGTSCEDYALAETLKTAAYAIVCDGCSSGRFTDVGARVLTFATVAALKRSDDILKITAERQKILEQSKNLLGLRQEDLYASCIYAYMTPMGGFINLVGDGVVAVKYHNGDVWLARFDWEHNMPFYPAYYNGDYEQFVLNHREEVPFKQENWLWAQGQFYMEKAIHYSLERGMSGITIPLLPLPDMEYIALFSDGITQIDGVDWKDAVVNLLNYKSTAGEFVKRRMGRGLKDFGKLGRGPLDDIACATIHIQTLPKEKIEEVANAEPITG